MKKHGYQLGDAIGQAGVEPTYDRYLRGDGRLGAAHASTRAAGRRARRVPTQPSTPGNDAPAHDRHRPPARRRAGAPLRHRARAREHGGLRRRRRRDRRARPARRRGARAGVEPDLPAVGLRRPQTRRSSRRSTNPNGRRSRELSRPQPRDRGRLSARLDVQAGDGARGDAGAPADAVLVAPVHAELSPPTSRRSTTGRRDIDQWMDLPTALAESCDTYFYQLGDDFYELPPNRGHPLQHWASRFGFGAADRHRRRPARRRASCRRRSGAASTYGGPPCQGYVDRIWKPGYSIQLAIGQGDLS